CIHWVYCIAFDVGVKHFIYLFVDKWCCATPFKALSSWLEMKKPPCRAVFSRVQITCRSFEPR
uniref:hypothetical protein n=1 Tax=Klebsiella pneumoniae TaxID=573 RepID=UPI001BCAAEBC